MNKIKILLLVIVLAVVGGLWYRNTHQEPQDLITVELPCGSFFYPEVYQAVTGIAIHKYDPLESVKGSFMQLQAISLSLKGKGKCTVVHYGNTADQTLLNGVLYTKN